MSETSLIPLPRIILPGEIVTCPLNKASHLIGVVLPHKASSLFTGDDQIKMRRNRRSGEDEYHKLLVLGYFTRGSFQWSILDKDTRNKEDSFSKLMCIPVQHCKAENFAAEITLFLSQNTPPPHPCHPFWRTDLRIQSFDFSEEQKKVLAAILFVKNHLRRRISGSVFSEEANDEKTVTLLEILRATLPSAQWDNLLELLKVAFP